MTAQRCLSVATVICTLVGVTSCASMRQWLSRDESQERAARLQEVQLRVMRYADEYGGGLTEPLKRFADAAASPEDRLAGQTWQLTQATAVYTIASGPNPMINLLDMAVLAALSRGVVESHWVSARYGERAAPLLEVHRALEQQAWVLCAEVLQPDQIAHLQILIEEWRNAHPHVREVALVRFKDFADATASAQHRAPHSGGGLFSLIGLDPLRNLDPAVREIEQTRQLAERTIYYLQRAPDLLDMQVQRLVYQLMVMPETRSTLLGAERIGLAAEALGRLADDLPATLASEREAWQRQLDELLKSEELRDLLAQAHATLESGADASASVQDAIVALTMLVQQMKAGRKQSEVEPRKPFDVTEYTAAVHEVALATRELQTLLSHVDPAATEGALQRLLDHVFWRCAQLIVLLLISSSILIAVRYALHARARSIST